MTFGTWLWLAFTLFCLSKIIKTEHLAAFLENLADLARASGIWASVRLKAGATALREGKDSYQRSVFYLTANEEQTFKPSERKLHGVER